MKDLGYPRTPTGLFLLVDMSTEKWLVPCQVIIDNYDEHYKDEESDMVRELIEFKLKNEDLLYWARNNMNWSDVEPYSEPVPMTINKADRQAYWLLNSHIITHRPED